MWIYLSQIWNRANTSEFFVILESLNALSTFYVFLFYSFWLLYMTFCTFCAFWNGNPAEGRVLSCEIWMKRWCGVFNLSCLIVTHFLWQCCMHMPFFWKESTLNMLQRNYIQSVTHCILLLCLMVFKDLPCTELDDM